MTTMATQRRGPQVTWGWGLVATVCVLLLVSATWLYVSVGTPALVLADTGVTLTDLEAAYPMVARELTARGRTIALLVAAVSINALTVTLVGWRSGAAWTRTVAGVFALTLFVIGAHALFAGRADIGTFYVGSAALATVGIGLAARGARS